MTDPISRVEFCKRWLLICLTSSIFAGFMYGYGAVMKHVFDSALSEPAINFVVACAVNIAAFVYIRWAVIPRMLGRGKGALYGIVMHLPLIAYINVAIIAFDLDRSILDNVPLNALGLAGVALAVMAFIEAAYLSNKEAPTGGPAGRARGKRF